MIECEIMRLLFFLPLLVFVALASPAHAQNTPRATMIRFLSAWKKQDTKGMAKASLRHMKAKPTDMEDAFGVKKLLSFQVTDEQKSSPVLSKVNAKITYSMIGGKPQTRTISGLVIKEDTNGKWSPSGTWGVNYLSVMREH